MKLVLLSRSSWSLAVIPSPWVLLPSSSIGSNWEGKGHKQEDSILVSQNRKGGKGRELNHYFGEVKRTLLQRSQELVSLKHFEDEGTKGN